MTRWSTARRIALPLTVFGFAHAAVDGACAALLLGAVTAGRIASADALSWFLLYNVAAFALQPGFGLLVDRWHADRPAAVIGAVVTACAIPLSLLPGMVLAAVVVAGFGNAIFHVGGGSVSLRLAPGSTSAPGIFVAPGAAGLASGTLLGKAGGPVWIFAAVLVALAVVMALVAPRFPGARSARSASRAMPTAGVEAAVLLVLIVVALRSFTGFVIPLPWKSQLPLLAALTAAVVLGKALGGVLADQFGRARIAVGALAFSAPLLMLAPQLPVAGVVGMFAFNMTMPVTLVAVAESVPEHPGFAFGLASLSILLGAFPLLAGWSPTLVGALPVALVVWGSATALGVALWWLAHGTGVARPMSSTIAEVAE